MILTTLLLLAQVDIPAGVRLDAVSSSAFTLETPRLDVHGHEVHVEGIVCRRPWHLGLSPEKVQIERVRPDGTVAVTQFAPLPPLPRRIDQRCARFGISLDPVPVAGERIRLCVAHAGSCSAG